MKTELVRVPFEVELAKKIQNGECDGRIVTRSNDSVRIICWDKKGFIKETTFPIVALRTCGENENYEQIQAYNDKGYANYQGLETGIDLFLEIPEYMTFKDGDVIAFGTGSVGIFKKANLAIKNFILYVALCGDKLFLYEENWALKNSRLATEEEKQKLIDALKESTEPQATEYLKRFFGIEEKKECEFKPFDKVLVRDNYCEKWSINFFSYMKNEDEYIYCCLSQCWKQCIPYEGNEKLLGTNNSPE